MTRFKAKRRYALGQRLLIGSAVGLLLLVIADDVLIGRRPLLLVGIVAWSTWTLARVFWSRARLVHADDEGIQVSTFLWRRTWIPWREVTRVQEATRYWGARPVRVIWISAGSRRVGVPDRIRGFDEFRRIVRSKVDRRLLAAD